MIDNRLTVHYQGRPSWQKSVQLTEGIDGLSIVLPDDVEPMTHIEVSVDQDRLTAHLHWQLVPGVQYRLADQVPKCCPAALRANRAASQAAHGRRCTTSSAV